MKTPAPARTSADAVALIVADIFQLAALLRRRGGVIAKKAGQTQPRWQVISAASSGNITVAQLARRLGVSRQGVQRVADMLVKDGLARFTKNRDNMRSPHLQLTKPGKKLLVELTENAATYNEELAEGLTEQELQSALIVLGKFRLQMDRDFILDRVGR
ncbi:MAG: MarR family winged helix-turn-helix transcriptional regulator [Acidobacteriaceae bacterium]